MEVIRAETLLDAWKADIDIICERGGEVLNLITEVTNPVPVDPRWIKEFDPHKWFEKYDSLTNVVRTIFPSEKFSQEDRERFYAYNLSLLERARRSGAVKSPWHDVYFERLVRFGGDKNQLESAIGKIIQWPFVAKTAFTFHLTSPSLGDHRHRGAPCWQYGQLICHSSREIDLVVVYRNHDFINKAFGNFIGLSRLLEFICFHTQRAPGRLVCHSVHAFVDSRANARLMAQ